MAKMTADFDPSDVLGGLIKFESDSEISKKMVEEGAKVMADAIKKGALSHKVTGAMSSSIYSTKGFKTKNGDCTMAKVRFGGKSKIYTSKSGKKYDITNWLKALRIEYGTKNQIAHPFIRPAIRSSKSAVIRRMKEVFEKETKS